MKRSTVLMVAVAAVLILQQPAAELLYAQESARILITGLERPTSLAATHDFLYVVEQGKNRILQIDYMGQMVQSTGNRGSGDYQFNHPQDLTTSTGLKVYVSDVRNHRIQVFDRHWQLLSSIRQLSALAGNRQLEPRYLALNNAQQLFFYDARTKHIIKIDDNGTFLDEFPLPSEVKEVSSLKTDGRDLLILDNRSSLIHVVTENGFYRSFYPADGAVSFRKYSDDLWTASRQGIFRNDALYLHIKDAFEEGETIVDFSVTEKYIFILGSRSLAAVKK